MSTATISHIDSTGATEVLGEFTLEPMPTESSPVPERVIDELRHARSVAKDYAVAFKEATDAQAEKYGIKAAALRRYIAALADDKLDDAKAEAQDLERLIDQ